MKVLYGTGNQAKLSAMKHRLEQLDIELISLNDLKTEGYRIPNAPEDGKTPLENARQKAQIYYNAFHIPVFSCDSGMLQYRLLIIRYFLQRSYVMKPS